jgi:hypothetical protein
MIHPLRMGSEQPRTQKRFWCSVLCAAIFVLVSSASAQNTASISGTVRDTTDALVPGAKVTLINEASKATRDTTSNGEGFFNFLAVQPATYSIRVQRTGFESWKVTGVEVHPGDNLTVPKINLKVGAIAESVTVTAEVAGVTLSSPEHSTMITSADIARLSTTGRDALELVSMLPGFTLNSGTSLNNVGADYNTTSFSSGNMGSYGANGSAPQSGQVNVVADGAQVTDPGDMGATTANINMDQVQEIKVQTSNFGADEAKGPIVINAVGKSGGAAYHGGLYMYARDHIFNSNDWLSKNAGISIAPSKYYYPGATIGGPVMIPGTHFNEGKKLTFWAGFEYYDQLNNTNGSYGGPTYAFIPTARMLGGDLSEASLASAFNVSPADLAAGCTEDYSQSGAYSNIGGDCYSPTATFDENGQPVNGGIISPTSINPAMATFTKFYPKPNVTPLPENGYASSGYNWAKNVMATNNGFQLHGRVDENVSDTLKIYGTYNWEKINTQNPLNNIYYNPPSTIPYPSPLDSYGDSNYSSLNVTKTLGNSITNEVVLAGLYFDQPQQFQDRAAALDTGTPWAAAGYSGGALKNGINQLPRIYSWEGIGIPNFSMGYVPASSEYLRKSSWNVTDNFTKVYHTHTIKAGVYAEQARNNNVPLGSQSNGTVLFDRYEGCIQNQTAPGYSTNPTTGDATLANPTAYGMGNTVGNFLIGCTGGYTQANSNPPTDMYFNTLEFYGTDEWKVNSKLTLTFGIRLSHLPPWSDAHGIGAAVWDPTKYNPIAPYTYDTNQTQNATSWPGISWHQLDSSIPVAGWGTTALFYQPRAGIAYDMYGNGKSVFRGGFGVYRSRDSANVTGGAVQTATNLILYQINTSFADSCTLDQLFNSAPVTTSLGNYPVGSKVVACGYYTGSYSGTVANGTYSGSPAFDATPGVYTTTGAAGVVTADDPHDKLQPVTYNYNFTLDQQLPRGVTLEVAYVGNQSTDLATVTSQSGVNLANVNAIPLGAFFGPDPLTGEINPAYNITSGIVNDYRPYPNYQAVNVPRHTNWANYNAMQVALNKQRGSLVFGINYTWSKAMGVRGNYDTGQVADPVNAHHDYGVVSYDRPEVINFSYSYQEGTKFHGPRELGWFLNNWELSGITTITSGPDLAIVNGTTNFSFSAGASYLLAPGSSTSVSIPVGASEWLGSSDYSLQPTVTCNPSANLHSKVLSGNTASRQYVNGNCFGLPTQGTQGWWNLPDVHGPAYFKSDLSIYKDIQINDRQNLQLRASGFNFLNHPISSFNNNNLVALDLTFEDPTCNISSGAGCYYTQQSAFAGMQLENSGFGYTPYKAGVRIVEFGVKYNF